MSVDILVADLTDETGIRAVEDELRSNTAIDALVNNAAPRRWPRSSRAMWPRIRPLPSTPRR